MAEQWAEVTKRPSQWVNLKWAAGALIGLFGTGYLLAAGLTSDMGEVALALAPALIGGLSWLWRYLIVSNTSYTLKSDRILIHTGVLNKQQDQIELFRVRDYQVREPFVYRFVGLGNVIIISTDRNAPRFQMNAISKAEEFKEQIRAAKIASGGVTNQLEIA